jgi:hypothetical protein
MAAIELHVTAAPAMARRIQLWPIDRLVPYEKNPRTHSAEQINQIATSIIQFGFNNPILVDSKDGLLAGHGRLLAARKLNLPKVPVVVLDHLTLTGFSDKELAELLGGDSADAPTGFAEYDENIPTEHKCPKCGYQWSGKS